MTKRTTLYFENGAWQIEPPLVRPELPAPPSPIPAQAAPLTGAAPVAASTQESQRQMDDNDPDINVLKFWIGVAVVAIIGLVVAFGIYPFLGWVAGAR